MKKLNYIIFYSALFTAGFSHADVTFEDSRGKLITLDKYPQKIVAIASSAPIIYSAVSQKPETIISMTAKSKKTIINGLYSDFFPYLKSVSADAAKDKFVPNVEAILKYNPDLIFQWGYDPKLSEPLERVGLTVATWPCCSDLDRQSTVLMSGYISGNIERAKMIINSANQASDTLKSTLSSINKNNYPTILEIDQLDQNIRIIANNSRDYSISGVDNLGHDDNAEWWKTINVEQLYIWNPEMIIIPAWAEQLTPNSFYTNPLLADLHAVKNRNVYKVPLFHRSPDASEAYLTMQWLAHISYPELFTNSSFIDKVRHAYKTIYGVDISENQYIRIMQTEQNKVSHDYEQKFGLKG
ncbi:ABC transporter substrate-binding protein [Moritella sp.]|uniref:ABC transporter substrate-binding protein n=1 Tax=Moritella sp. TaxID=78556 RepID=UPI0025CD4CD1|nr:ABC transporter substrate-binding protein [Moritella sp.]MCJ8352373.1 ABC transporter substrate-binding protein [Moritella sp.]